MLNCCRCIYSQSYLRFFILFYFLFKSVHWFKRYFIIGADKHKHGHEHYPLPSPAVAGDDFKIKAVLKPTKWSHALKCYSLCFHKFRWQWHDTFLRFDPLNVLRFWLCILFSSGSKRLRSLNAAGCEQINKKLITGFLRCLTQTLGRISKTIRFLDILGNMAQPESDLKGACVVFLII